MMKRRGGAPVLLVLLLCGCVGSVFSRSSRAVGGTTESRCNAVRTSFESKNISVEYLGTENSSTTTCKGHCCNSETEDRFRIQARADYHNLIHYHSKYLQGSLATTADKLREMVTVLARQSENTTLTLFTKVYASMVALSRPLINTLYQELVKYVSPENTPETLQQPITREILEEKFTEFFTHLFPIAYHHTVDPDEPDFTEEFKKCLYDAMDDIKPFGNVPMTIAQSVGKSLEGTRVLIQALNLGRSVLDQTDTILFSSESPEQKACTDALLRMTYCPKCKGNIDDIGPCHVMCINVMRGCLAGPASELDRAWSGYAEAVEGLVVAVNGHANSLGLNAEKAMQQLDVQISESIIFAMSNGPQLVKTVEGACGPAKTVARSSKPSVQPVLPLEAVTSHRVPDQLHDHLVNFLASIRSSESFYGNLAERMCEKDDGKPCWNGERVGEYSKAQVTSGFMAQKYNPEFMPSQFSPTLAPEINAKISEISDQLRHIKQVVQSQLSIAPESGAFLGDRSVDGSGSGDDEDIYSGSGGDSSTIDSTDTDDVKSSEPTKGSQTAISPLNSSLLTFLSLICILFFA